MIFAVKVAYQPLPEWRAIRVLCVLGKPTPQCLIFSLPYGICIHPGLHSMVS